MWLVLVLVLVLLGLSSGPAVRGRKQGAGFEGDDMMTQAHDDDDGGRRVGR